MTIGVGELALGKVPDSKYFKRWFGASEAVDEEVRAKFAVDLEWLSQTMEGPTDPQESLARIIVLDQFSRNIHRDTPAMFASDARALQLARESVSVGWDQRIHHPLMRAFIYMPFMHAEDLAAQEEGMRLFKTVFAEQPEGSAFRENLARNVEYMRKHRDIVSRFGRFPHRNRILGRPSTKEEEEYLANGGETFDARTQRPSS